MRTVSEFFALSSLIMTYVHSYTLYVPCSGSRLKRNISDYRLNTSVFSLNMRTSWSHIKHTIRKINGGHCARPRAWNEQLRKSANISWNRYTLRTTVVPDHIVANCSHSLYYIIYRRDVGCNDLSLNEARAGSEIRGDQPIPDQNEDSLYSHNIEVPPDSTTSKSPTAAVIHTTKHLIHIY